MSSEYSRLTRCAITIIGEEFAERGELAPPLQGEARSRRLLLSALTTWSAIAWSNAHNEDSGCEQNGAPRIMKIQLCAGSAARSLLGFRRWTGRAGRASTFQDGLADGTSGYRLGRLEEFSPHSPRGAKENSHSSPSLLYLFFITYAVPSSYFKVIKALVAYSMFIFFNKGGVTVSSNTHVKKKK